MLLVGLKIVRRNPLIGWGPGRAGREMPEKEGIIIRRGAFWTVGHLSKYELHRDAVVNRRFRAAAQTGCRPTQTGSPSPA